MVLISVRGWANHRSIVLLEELRKLEKKSNGLIRNRTRNFPACNIVPQISTLSRAPSRNFWHANIDLLISGSYSGVVSRLIYDEMREKNYDIWVVLEKDGRGLMRWKFKHFHWDPTENF
jgi:hypothetical protein